MPNTKHRPLFEHFCSRRICWEGLDVYVNTYINYRFINRQGHQVKYLFSDGTPPIVLIVPYSNIDIFRPGTETPTVVLKKYNTSLAQLCRANQRRGDGRLHFCTTCRTKPTADLLNQIADQRSLDTSEETSRGICDQKNRVPAHSACSELPTAALPLSRQKLRTCGVRTVRPRYILLGISCT